MTLGFGSQQCREPAGVRAVKVRGLGGRVGSHAGLGALGELLEDAEVVHVHNVMNPVALQAACATGRCLVTVQDHRVFCPGPGKTLPDGSPCQQRMSADACAGCFEDPVYAQTTLALTEQRLQALRAAAAVLVLSRYMQQELATVGVESTVIPPWVEVCDEEHEREGVLIGGRLVRHKAPLEAVAAWRESGTEQPLLVAGAGALLAHLPGEHLGWLPREQLHGLLSRVRVLLFCARWQEPFGILGLEALARGTPVIAWRRGGVPEWAQAGALLVDGPGEAAEALARLDADSELRFRLGTEARDFVRETYGQADLLARLEDVYEGVRCL